MWEGGQWTGAGPVQRAAWPRQTISSMLKQREKRGEGCFCFSVVPLPDPVGRPSPSLPLSLWSSFFSIPLPLLLSLPPFCFSLPSLFPLILLCFYPSSLLLLPSAPTRPWTSLNKTRLPLQKRYLHCFSRELVPLRASSFHFSMITL